MKQRLLKLMDKILLRKRSLIESVNDQLKNICQIEHSRSSQWLELPSEFDGRLSGLHLSALVALIGFTAKGLTGSATRHLLICRTHVNKKAKISRSPLATKNNWETQ